MRMFLFVLETIRTSAMRVIHITVKTEETQRLRIVFTVLPEFELMESNKINECAPDLPYHLATDRHIWQRVDITTFG